MPRGGRAVRRERGERDPLAATGAYPWRAGRQGQGRRPSYGKDRGPCRLHLGGDQAAA